MTLALLRTYSLENLAEGWTADCKIIYRAVTFGDIKDLQGLKDLAADEEKAIEAVVQFVKDHFVSGKGMQLQEGGEQALGDISIDDISELPLDTISDLFTKMTGQATDPKVIDTETSTAS